MSATREEVFFRFLEVVKTVWSERTAAELNITLGGDEPQVVQGTRGEPALAGLVYAGTPMAFGNRLVVRSKHYMLLVSERLLALDDESIRRILVHEAVHIGYRGHDTRFREVVRQFNGAVSESAVTNPKIRVEYQAVKGQRFVKLEQEFESEREAAAWAKEEYKRKPGRYRLLMGLDGTGEESGWEKEYEEGDEVLVIEGDEGAGDLGRFMWPDRLPPFPTELINAIGAVQVLVQDDLREGGNFVPAYETWSGILEASFNENFPRPEKSDKLYHNAKVVWESIIPSNLGMGSVLPNEIVRSPEDFIWPQSLLDWARLIMPQAKWARGINIYDVFEDDDEDIIIFPRLAFNYHAFRYGNIPFLGFFFRRPKNVGEARWRKLREARRVVEWKSDGRGGSEPSVMRAEKDARAWFNTLVAKTAGGHSVEESESEATLRHVFPVPFDVTNETLIEATGEELVFLNGYEGKVAVMLQEREKFRQSMIYRPSRAGGTSDATLKKLGPLYVGMETLDYDQNLAFVPPMVYPPEMAGAYGISGRGAQVRQLVAVDPSERQYLRGVFNIDERGVTVEEGFARDEGFKPFTEAVTAYDWDWADMFARYGEDDDERIGERQLDEYDQLCWPESSEISRKEALEWLARANVRRNTKRMAGSLVGGTGGNWPWPDDWSDARVDPSDGRWEVGGYRFLANDIPPRNVRIALGQKIVDSSCHNTTLPLWFMYACRRDGVEQGHDWVGDVQLRVFDWLYGLSEKALKAMRHTKWDEIYRSIWTGGTVGKFDVRHALRFLQRPFEMTLGQTWTYLPVTTDPSICKRSVGGRYRSCYVYDITRDPKLVTLLRGENGVHYAMRDERPPKITSLLTDTALFKEVL